MRQLAVLEPGPLATVQDLGRPGLAGLGVTRSGAADPDALRLGNRLVGNDEGLAGVEATHGGLVVQALADLLVALTGAPCPATVDGREIGFNAPVALATGAVLRLGSPGTGMRSYLAVRGGVDVPLVLGSRSTDVLSGLGHAPLRAGARLPVGPPPSRHPHVDHAPAPALTDGEVELRVLPGPRVDWFAPDTLDRLTASAYEVTPDSNRSGMRLRGTILERARTDELPSEGMVPGALQVPPTGQPTLFLVDHPVTGGYPVVAVVVSADLGRAGQLRPGQAVRFTAAR
ncbi:MAG TPA: biotin-dependent carboxyltransferase family protein [Marmoricola sp.]|nr:biotin-dependent carboxyltransferase family protein [Marmoricola sp.]